MLELGAKNLDGRYLMKWITSLVLNVALDTATVAVFTSSALAHTDRATSASALDEAGAAKYQEDLAHPASHEPAKPTPRLADGKVDFSGKGVWAAIWVLDWADKRWVDRDVDVPFTPWVWRSSGSVARTYPRTTQKATACRLACPAIPELLTRFRSFSFPTAW